MSKLLVLGSSPAAVKAIELIRANDQDIEITVIIYEGTYPYKRDIFPEVIKKNASVEDIYCRDKKFYEENKINVIPGQTVTRINLKTRKIYTEEKVQYDFDQIILAETPQGTKLTSLKGGNKEGIYALRKIQYVDKLIKELPFYDTVVLESNTFAGLQAAEALIKHGKEVYLIVPEDSPFRIVKDDEKREVIQNSLKESKLHIIDNASIEEILGDAELKAVRLSSGKVLAADIVVLGELKDDLKLLSEFGLNILEDRIVVGENYQTNLDGVFAVDGLTAHHSHKWWSDFASSRSLEEQGVKIANAITGADFSTDSFIVEKMFECNSITVSFLHGSQVNETNGSGYFVNAAGDGYIATFTQDDVIKAAILVNCDSQKDAVKELIVNGVNEQSMVVSLGLTEQKEDVQDESGDSEQTETSVNETSA